MDQEEFDHTATMHEAANEWAENYGAGHSDQAWILHDRDVWMKNPFYHGPFVPHPEDDDYPSEDEINAELACEYADYMRDCARDEAAEQFLN